MTSWWDSIVRVVVSVLAGIGTACFTNHLTHRPNAAFLVSVLVTGISIAVLNRQSRTDSGTTPRGSLIPKPKPVSPPIVQSERNAEASPSTAAETSVGHGAPPPATGPGLDLSTSRNSKSHAAPVPSSASVPNNAAAHDEREPLVASNLPVADTPAAATDSSSARAPVAQTSPLSVETAIADQEPSPHRKQRLR